MEATGWSIYLVCVVKISQQINFISINAHHVKTENVMHTFEQRSVDTGRSWLQFGTKHHDHPVFFTFTYFTQQCDWDEIGKKLFELGCLVKMYFAQHK